MNVTNRQRVEEMSQVGEARRVAVSMGHALGFDDAGVGNIAIVATELATNLVKHAGGGEIIVRTIQMPNASGIEMLSLDKGPGIKHVGQSLRDGYSTSESLGTGLGAIRRLSSLFDLYSKPHLGTAVLSGIWRQSSLATPSPPPLEVGAVCLPIATEEACGDAWVIHQSGERAVILLADGLGHGQDAAQASAAAVTVCENHAANSTPAELIERMHAALRGTRGAAVAVAEVLTHQRIVRYAGMGNISGRILSGETERNLFTNNGTVGMESRKIQEFTYDWPEDGLLILHSDGLDTHWNLNNYPGLRSHHPALVAGVLFRDHSRIRDDSTVLAVEEARRSP